MENTPLLPACAVVGRGRLGRTLTASLRAAGVSVEGPLGRGGSGSGTGADVVLLCVPDAEIAAAAAAITPRDGLLVGHCSGATSLAPLAPHEAFSLHPLMTVPASGADLRGAPAALAGATERARAVAARLAAVLGLEPFAVEDADRAAYHAAASMASNFLVTLEWAAQRVGGLERAALVPLVRATVEHWAAQGPHAALTGPIARGDEATVTRQREAVRRRAPELTELFDALADATRTLAHETAPVPA